MKKVTKIILATSLIASLSSVAMAATHHKRGSHSRESISSSSNNDIRGVKFLLGAGVGTGLDINTNKGFNVNLAPNAGLDAKLKLGTGIFTTTRSSTLGLQATIGVGANSIGSTSSFNPQYSVNLDFIQAFKLGSTGYIKLGYILGAGVAIRTNDGGSNGRGNFSGNSVVGAAVARINGIDNSAANGYTLPDSAGGVQGADYNSAISLAKQAYNSAKSGNFQDANTQIAAAQTTAKKVTGWSFGGGIGGMGGIGGSSSAILATDYTGGHNVNSYNENSTASNRAIALSTDLNDTINNLAVLIKQMQDTRISGLNSQLTSLQNQLNQANSDKTTQQDRADTLQSQLDTANNKTIPDLKSQISTLTTEKSKIQEDLNTANTTVAALKATSGQLTPEQTKALNAAKQQVTDLTAELGTANTNLTKAQGDLESTKTQLSAVTAQLDELKRQNRIAAANEESEAERRRRASANNTPSLMPTLKAGLIAFIGKHQAVSLEYQYYFRNTMPNTASSDISFNYTYYFGSN
ncbi:hypothetical protein [Helicobacter sp. 11S02629-2]|uniref:hypothetical protein n=1 Tax=Helicobacter sp. 11S02629-2 TaxID=1476195 RepID=UPI000BA7682A|nr:hypothetical protein [Helicobacter sp. 11S02629-2]PAF45745.1 hypothetical protein BKH40_02395 [Helicobacter sp. 11S02629-2]